MSIKKNKTWPSLPGKNNRLASESGNFTLLFALTFVVLLALLSYALDAGFFIREKNRYQACAEAAAMAAINQCCFAAGLGELTDIVMDVINGSNLNIPETSVSVETGFYDTFDEYEPFAEFENFVSRTADDYPVSETWNAILVTIRHEQNPLVGMQGSQEIHAAAVAYLPRVSMVSKGTRFWLPRGNTSIHNGNLYAARGLRYLDRITVGQDVLSAQGNERLPESPVIDNHIMEIETYLKILKKKADRIYTLADAYQDAFYDVRETSGNITCFFDFSGPRSRHEIIFIDIPETLPDGRDTRIYLMPDRCMDDGAGGTGEDGCPTRTPFGNSIRNLTIGTLTNVTIHKCAQVHEIGIGDTDFGQFSLVTPRNINLYTSNKSINGINLIAGYVHIYMETDSIPIPQSFLRIISDGNIIFTSNNQNLSDQFNFYLKFGPPCPPIIPPSLGFLEPGTLKQETRQNP